MEPKQQFNLLSFIFFIFLLNPFPVSPHEYSPHQRDTKNPSSPLDYLNNLIGTRKGNTAKGISQLKKYLSNLGYMNSTITNNITKPTHENDDYFDDNLEQAIRNYQKFFKLTINGILDANTVANMKQPRCGVPDYFTNHNKTQFHGLIPIIASHYAFFPGTPKWPPTKRKLTYSFPQDMRSDVKQAVLDASNLWASVSPFKFTYIPNYDQADIKISFQYRDHGDGLPFDGPGGILAHSFAPSDGRLHYDGDERWVDGVVPGAFDLQTLSLHELGHILGLAHTSDGGAIMFPSIGDGFRKGLGQDDINGIRALYPS
ncbi:hypothetical protein DH2020_000967 [Rehmannia glutinosa]|uniref:Peptidase metallopeptidase domain-containing protein n=1 Tax=Rehmannia glutinosa TaxID=99300 RepID=A0ABR0XY30_REHGL